MNNQSNQEQEFRRSVEQRDFKAIVQNFKKLSEPSNRNWIFMAMALMELHRFQDAIEEFKKILEREREKKRRIYIYLNMGIAFFRLKQTKEALSILSNIEDPKKLEGGYHLQFFKLRGEVHLSNQSYHTALTDFYTCLQKNPDDPEVFQKIIDAYLEIHQEEEAEEALAKLEKITGQTAKTHFMKAKIYEIKRDYDNEIKELKNALWIDPKFPGALLKLAFLQAKLGLQGAEESFQKYSELKKDDKESLKNIEKIKEEAKVQAKIHRCTKIIEDKELDSEAKVVAYWERACAYRKKGVEHCALQDSREITQLKSNNSEIKKQAWHLLGTFSEDEGNFSSAIKQYSQAIGIDPKFEDALLNRAFLYLREGERKEISLKEEERKIKFLAKESKKSLAEKEKQSKKEAQMIEKWCPPHFSEEKKQNSKKVKVNNFYEATKDFTCFIDLNGKTTDIKVYNARGRAFLKLRNYQKALKDFNKALEIHSQDVEAQFLKGVALYHLDDYSKASQLCQKGKGMEEHQFQAYQVLGDCSRKDGNYKQALESYAKLIQLDKKCHEAYCKRGFILLKQGQYEEAIGQFNQTLEIGSGNASAFYGRGKAFENVGLSTISLQNYKAAIETDQEHIFCLASLAMKVKEEGPGSYEHQLFELLDVLQIEEIKQKYDLSRSEAEDLESSIKNFLKQNQKEKKQPLSNIKQQLVRKLSLLHLPEPETKLRAMKNYDSKPETKIVEQEHAQ